MYVTALFTLVSIITPARMWNPPPLPLTVNVKAEGESRLVLTNFDGKELPAKTPTDLRAKRVLT